MKRPLTRSQKILSLAFGLALAAMAPSSNAASFNWDASSAGSSSGGTGVWTSGTANWYDGTTDQAWTDTAGTTDIAIFGGTAGTVTIGGTQGALGLIFNTTGYTIQSGTLNLGASGIDASALSSGTTAISSAIVLGAGQSWNIGTGASLTASGQISGANSLTTTGAGTLTLSSASNTFSGGLTISAGTVAVSGANANAALGGSLSGTNGAVTINGGTLQVGLQAASVATTNTHVITVGANGGTLRIVPGGNFKPTYNIGSAGNLTGSGALTVTGTGILGTPGANNSVLVIGAANTGFTGNMVLQNGGIAELGNATPIATSGTFVLNNQGELALNGFTMGVPVIVNNGGVLGFNAASANYSGAISLTGSANVRGQDWFDTTVRAGTISGLVSGAGTLYVGSGSGSGGGVTLTNNSNSYSGGTVVTGASVGVGNNNVLGTGTLTLNGNATLYNSASIIGMPTNIVVSGAGNAIQLGGAFNLSLTGTISGSGALTLGNNNSNSSVYMNFTNSMTSGTVTLANNTNSVRFSSASAGNANLAWIFNNTSSNKDTLDFTTGTVYFGSMTGGGLLTGNNSTGTKTVQVGDLGYNETFSGVIGGGSGTIALIKSGGGTWAVTGANTYSGGIALNGGKVNLGVAQVGTTSGPLGSNGTISFGGGALQYTSVNQTDYSSRFSTAAGQAYSVDTNGQTVTWASALTSSGGSLTKSGSGMLILSGTSTYSGLTAITSGSLRLTGILSSSGSVSLGAATLQGSGSVGALTVNNSGAVIANGNGVAGNTSTLTLGSLTFSNAGTLNLSKFNDTTTAPLAIAGALATTAGITINVPTSPTWTNGQTYNLISYGSFSGNATDFIKGTIAGLGARQSATLGSTGAGSGFITLAIAGDTPYWTGAENNNWTITSGTAAKNWKLVTAQTATDFLTNDQVLFDDNATGSTAVNISDANVAVAAVNFNNAAKNYTISSTGGYGIVDGSAPAPLNVLGTGTVTLATTNGYTGVTTINAGQLQLGDGTVNGDIATSSSVNNNGTLVFNRNGGSFTYANVISGTGSVVMTGNGTQILTGANSYSGVTTVNSGTLQLGNGGTTGSLAATGTIANNGSLVINRSNAVAQGTDFGLVSGTGSLTKVGTGTLTLSLANTYIGGTIISSGTVSVGNNSALGTGDVALNGGALTNGAVVTIGNNLAIGASGATLSVGTSNDFTLSGTLSGAGNINILSTGFAKSLNWNFTANTMTSGTITMANGGTNTTVFRMNNPAATSSALDWVLGGASDRGMTLGASGTFNYGSLGGSGILQAGQNGTPITISIGGNNHDATFSGKILDNGSTVSVVKVGAGNETFSGASNAYSGSTTVNGGTLTLSNNFSASSAMTVNNGGTLVVGGTFSGAGAFTVNSGGTVTVNGNKSGAGTVTVANGGTLNGAGSISGTVNISGALSGSVTVGGDLVINDTGSMDGAHTFSGNVALNNSTLANVSSDITLAAGKTLSGVGGSTGTVTATVLGSVIAPGNSGIGNLSMGNLSTATGAHLSMDINGTTAGGYDTVTVANIITLSGGDLTLNIGSFTPGPENIYLVINNIGGPGANFGTSGAFDSITLTGSGTGSFSGAEGTQFTMNGTTYTLTYQADFGGDGTVSGNDIALIAAVPEPSTWAMIVGGLGMLVSFQRSRRRN